MTESPDSTPPTSAAPAPPAFLSRSLPLAARARDLLSRLTLAEKCSQLTYDSPAIPRLGIPAHNWWNECLHGVARAGLATVFPQAIGLASTFDTDLVHRVACAISDEARAKHHAHAARGDFGIYKGLSFWSPNINIFRDPRWGRGHETYGECPHLTSRMAVAFIRGLQGDDPRFLKTIATPKHFAAHSGPENGRHGFDARVSLHDLHDTYLPAFHAAIAEAKAFSIMGAYNRLNGTPCCASDLLLNQILRNDWGFEGYTVSDCGAIADIHGHHKVTPSPAHSAALALANGLDLCCGSDYQNLMDALSQKLITEAQIDRALLRLLAARFKLGVFDPPDSVPFTSIAYDVVDSPENRALSLEAARASIVLLKNQDNLLPLSKEIRSIAIIGPNASAPLALLGNYHGTPPYIITPLDAIRAKLGPSARVRYAQGCTHLPTEGPWIGTSTRGFVEAVLAAEQSDVTVLCLGLTPTIEGEEGDALNSDAAGDRTRIELPEIQERLLQAIVATGKPIVLVLISGSTLAIPWAHDHVPAILQQFYPGQDGGTALADILFGDHNPSGRLPVTVYRATADLPPFEDYSMARRTYRYFNDPVLYPFGFGLSYTTFEYSNLQILPSTTGVPPVRPCTTRVPPVPQSSVSTLSTPFQILATVKNTGPLPGHEIAQLYVEYPPTSAAIPYPIPLRKLAAFQRIHLSPGQSATLTFTVTPDQLNILDDKGHPTSPPGPIAISVAGSQPTPHSQELGAPKPLRILLNLGGTPPTTPPNPSGSSPNPA